MVNNIINKHIIEIRFSPNPEFIDKRGLIATRFTGAGFNKWSIGLDRVELIHAEYPSLQAFFSMNNFGISSNYPISTNQLKGILDQFLKTAWPLFPVNTINRIGVKSSTLLESKDFILLLDAYKKKFLKLEDHELKLFGGELVDMGVPLNFVSGLNSFNVSTGPMESRQHHLMFGENPLGSAIYVDVDYFRNDFSPHIIARHAFDFVVEGLNKAETIVATVLNLLKENQ